MRAKWHSGGVGLTIVLYWGEDPLSFYFCVMGTGWGCLTSNPVSICFISFTFFVEEEESPSHLLLLRLVKPWPWGQLISGEKRRVPAVFGVVGHGQPVAMPTHGLAVLHGGCHLGGDIEANHAGTTEPTELPVAWYLGKR